VDDLLRQGHNRTALATTVRLALQWLEGNSENATAADLDAKLEEMKVFFLL
jgi:hypothetical protein